MTERKALPLCLFVVFTNQAEYVSQAYINNIKRRHKYGKGS
nr:MAG TPA: hypothetical protein [Caudoviricetes sp.]